MSARALAITILAAYAAVGFCFCFGKPVVVLPERFKDREVIVRNSDVFKALRAHDKKIADQLDSERKIDGEFRKRVDAELRAKDDELQKLRADKAASHKNIFGYVLSVAGLALQFVSNPFAFIMTRVAQIAAAIVLTILLVAAWRLWRRYHKRKTQ